MSSKSFNWFERLGRLAVRKERGSGCKLNPMVICIIHGVITNIWQVIQFCYMRDLMFRLILFLMLLFYMNCTYCFQLKVYRWRNVNCFRTKKVALVKVIQKYGIKNLKQLSMFLSIVTKHNYHILATQLTLECL